MKDLAQLLALPPLVHAALCQPELLEHKHGLCAVFGSQIETMCEVILPSQEGIEVVRDEQDLVGEKNMRCHDGAPYRTLPFVVLDRWV